MQKSIKKLFTMSISIFMIMLSMMPAANAFAEEVAQPIAQEKAIVEENVIQEKVAVEEKAIVEESVPKETTTQETVVSETKATETTQQTAATETKATESTQATEEVKSSTTNVSASISGYIKLATKDTLSEFKITVTDAKGNEFTATSGDKGDFYIASEKFIEGTAVIKVSKIGYKDYSSKIDIISGSKHELSINMEKSLESKTLLSGLILDENKEAIPNAQVVLVDKKGVKYIIYSDSKGYYSFSDSKILEGAVSIEISANGYITKTTTSEIKYGSELNQNYVLTKAKAVEKVISGVVQVPQVSIGNTSTCSIQEGKLEVVENALVKITDSKGKVFETLTDKNGSYIIKSSELADGDIKLEISKTGIKSQVKYATLATEKEQTKETSEVKEAMQVKQKMSAINSVQEVNFETKKNVVSGKVLDKKTNKELVGSIVELIDTAGAYVKQETDSNGCFIADSGLTAGSVKISVGKNGYSNISTVSNVDYGNTNILLDPQVLGVQENSNIITKTKNLIGSLPYTGSETKTILIIAIGSLSLGLLLIKNSKKPVYIKKSDER